MNEILAILFILFLIGCCLSVWYEYIFPMINWIIDKILDLIEYIRRKRNE